MKLRIKGNSLRLRVTQSDLTRLVTEARIEDTMYFGPEERQHLTYALEHNDAAPTTHVASRPQEIAVILPSALALAWAHGDDVGIYETVDLGPRGALQLVIEKDFACLDLSDAENADTFPNPNTAAVC